MFAMVKPNPEDVIVQFERWAAKRPIAPKQRRPRPKVRTMHPGLNGLLFYLAVMVTIIVVAYVSTTGLVRSTTGLVITILVTFFAIQLGPSTWVALNNVVRRSHYKRRMETTGWRLYDIKFEAWQRQFDDIDPQRVVDPIRRKKYNVLRHKGY